MANPDADSTHGAKADDGTAVVALEVAGEPEGRKGRGHGGTCGMLRAPNISHLIFSALTSASSSLLLPCPVFFPCWPTDRIGYCYAIDAITVCEKVPWRQSTRF